MEYGLTGNGAQAEVANQRSANSLNGYISALRDKVGALNAFNHRLDVCLNKLTGRPINPPPTALNQTTAPRLVPSNLMDQLSDLNAELALEIDHMQNLTDMLNNILSN